MYVFRGVFSVQGLIQSISNARGDKKDTRSSSWGEGPLTPINPPHPTPFHFLPGVLGLCQECPGSHCPLVLCFW